MFPIPKKLGTGYGLTYLFIKNIHKYCFSANTYTVLNFNIKILL